MAYDVLLFNQETKEKATRICTVENSEIALKCVNNWNENANDEDETSKFYADMEEIGDVKRDPFEFNLSDLVFHDDFVCSFLVDDNDDMVDTLNRIRLEKGNTTLVDCMLDNSAYYDFYLICNIKEKTLRLSATFSDTINPRDYYEIPMNEQDKENAMKAVLRAFFDYIVQDCKQWQYIESMFNLM